MRHTLVALVLSALVLGLPFGAVAQDAAGDSADVTVVAEAPAATPVVEAPAPTPTPAPAAPSMTDDPADMLAGAKNAASGGHWAAFVGFALMLLVWVARKVVPALIPTKAVPWVPTGLAMVGYVGSALATDGDWKQAVVQGFIAGASAVGLWEMLFKHFLAKKAA